MSDGLGLTGAMWKEGWGSGEGSFGGVSRVAGGGEEIPVEEDVVEE